MDSIVRIGMRRLTAAATQVEAVCYPFSILPDSNSKGGRIDDKHWASHSAYLSFCISNSTK
ncbi:MAG: hypothetical protein KC917_09700, partial [Candidatus Omnitrophica bacterium]|nr:hypothetical protein [Candidatus Omnitrophota bacterium]